VGGLGHLKSGWWDVLSADLTRSEDYLSLGICLSVGCHLFQQLFPVVDTITAELALNVLYPAAFESHIAETASHHRAL